MKTLLLIHSSGRVTRSITRKLSARFVEKWLAHNPDGRVLERDLTSTPPPVVNEAWIAAAFAEPQSQEIPEKALQVSEELIEELISADLIVLGAPMYNFGMPAQLKAYIDQIVRIGRTFVFEPANPEPYRALVSSDKPVVVITSAGDGDIHPGGPLAHMNYLEPHLTTVLGFIGLTDLRFIRAGYDEYQDDRTRRSVARAESEVDQCVDNLTTLQPATAD